MIVYKVKQGIVQHDGIKYREGDTIPLSEKEASRIMMYLDSFEVPDQVEIIPEKIEQDVLKEVIPVTENIPDVTENIIPVTENDVDVLNVVPVLENTEGVIENQETKPIAKPKIPKATIKNITENNSGENE